MMKNHLSSEQIARLVVAEADSTEISHTRECHACRAEIENLRNALSLFQNSVSDWSDRQPGARVPDLSLPVRAPAAFWSLRFRWPLATAILGLLAVFPIYQARQQQIEAQAAEDNLLLADIDARLSRTTPMALDPLTELVPEEANVRTNTEEDGDIQ